MNVDDIIRLSDEAGIDRFDRFIFLQRFAILVAAAEREACAELCGEMEDRENSYERNVAVLDCASAIRARGDE